MDPKGEKLSGEAPASMNFRLAYRGVDVQFTNRVIDIEMKPYMEKAKTAIDWALDKGGYSVPVQKSFGKKEIVYVEGKKCPECGGRLIKKVSKEGKEYHACENGKYDFLTKTTSGCKFVDWLDKPQTREEQIDKEFEGILDGGGTTSK
jgi:hypothetical protein